jgi:uncharacterized protein (TIGR02266 family)
MTKTKVNRLDRIPLQVVIKIAGKSDTFASFCRNLSAGGMFLETATPMAKGTPLVIELTLPNSKRTLTLNCRTAWIKQAKAPGEASGMGLRFEGLTDKETEELERSIAYLTTVIKGNAA